MKKIALCLTFLSICGAPAIASTHRHNDSAFAHVIMARQMVEKGDTRAAIFQIDKAQTRHLTRAGEGVDNSRVTVLLNRAKDSIRANKLVRADRALTMTQREMMKK